MTDDESRKAFEEWDAAFQYSEHDNWYATWQAAVEWATKRERERCANLCRETVDFAQKQPHNYDLPGINLMHATQANVASNLLERIRSGQEPQE